MCEMFIVFNDIILIYLSRALAFVNGMDGG